MKHLFTLLALTIGFNVNAQDFWFQGTSTDAIQTANAKASGAFSTAMGSSKLASGWYSTAMGDNTTASGGASTAMGTDTTAIGAFSTAMGRSTTASGGGSTAMGINTTASGRYSTAMGDNTTASDYGSLVIGQHNLSGSTPTSADSFDTANTAFVIGNGTFDVANLEIIASDAFKVMFNGDTTVGNDLIVEGDVVLSESEISLSAISLRTNYGTDETITVTNSQGRSSNAIALTAIAGGVNINAFDDIILQSSYGKVEIRNDLTVNGNVMVSSDARLKANIVSLGATLAKLLLIDGKSYTMKKDGKQKIGVLAQDIQKVFPELVSTDDRDMLAVNYQGLVPVLINALKEQDSKMKEQEKRLERLEAIISKMDK